MAESAAAEAAFQRARTSRNENRLADAEAAYRQCLGLAPRYVAAWINLGNVLHAQGRLQEAMAAHRQALALEPDNAIAHNSLSVALIQLGQFAEAQTQLEHAARQDPGYAAPWGNLGLVHTHFGRLSAAEQALAAALERAPADSNYRFHCAQLALLQGRFEEGWAGYEARRDDGRYPTPPPGSCALWQGEPLDGRTLLLVREQGFGDQIQFLRYAPLLAARGAIVDVCVAPELKTLATTLHGIRQVLSDLPDASAYYFWAPLPGLPGRCGTRLDSIPAAVPYLHADTVKVAAWRARLAGSHAKAGLVWSGRPTHAEDRFRSIPLAALKPLAGVAGWQFYALQKGDVAERQLADWPIAALGPHLHDFAETAAAITALDLVITVDTSVAHLAGALGKPVWLLLDAAPDWRWLLDRTDSPWYPTARLFRQRVRGDWQPVVQSVVAALQTLTVTRSAPRAPTGGLAGTR